jgi:GNAT superfamily N-acetyltransferase
MADLRFRDAVAADLPAIVAMLADDVRGRAREKAELPLAGGYLEAFAAIEASPHMRLLVALEGERVVASLQLLILPGLARQGSRRGQIEAVRVAGDRRGRGIGEALVRRALDECRASGCATVQLTSDNSRTDAHRFWERLGFAPSHRGFKLLLADE